MEECWRPGKVCDNHNFFLIIFTLPVGRGAASCQGEEGSNYQEEAQTQT